MKKETTFFLGGAAAGFAAGILACALAFVAVVGWQVRAMRAGAAARRDGLSRLVEGKPAFDFELQDVNPRSSTFGRSLKLSDLYAGRGAVVNFMASWCGPCRDELPDLQQIQADGVARVVCVAADEEGGPESLRPLIERAGLTVPVLYAPDDVARTLAKHYPHQGIPTTYLIDGSGTIRKAMTGSRPGSVFRDAIAGTIGSSPRG